MMRGDPLVIVSAKKVLFGLVAMCIGPAALFVIGELTMIGLRASEGFRALPVTAADPAFRFEPNRTWSFSRYWDLSLRNRVHTNNRGFISNIDYDPASSRPLVAFIGDSFVEAVMVPWAESVQGRLHNELGDSVRFYSFGSSGSPLSQYLAYAEYARDTFQPERMVFLIIGNDYDESLLHRKDDPGHHYFRIEDDGSVELTRVDFDRSPIRLLASKSRFLRYLVESYHETTIKVGIATTDIRYVGGTFDNVEPDRVNDSKIAVDAFLARLPEASGLARSQILIAVDGIRRELYDPAALERVSDSYVALMRRYMIENAEQAGFEVIDMQPIFIEDYKRRGERFEFPTDAHWNGNGHGVFAQVVKESRTIGPFLRNGGEGGRVAQGY